MIKRHLVLPLVDQAVVSGSSFVSTVLIARHLSKTEFGVYSIAWMIAIFFAGLQSALILYPLISLGPQKPSNERGKFFSDLLSQQFVFTSSCAVAIAACAVPLGLYIFSEPVPVSFALALGAVCASSQIQEFQRRLLFTEGKPVAALVSDVLRYGGQVAVLALGFLFGLESSADILWVTAATAAAAVVAFPPRFEGARLAPRYVLRQFRRNWHFTSWLVGSSLLTGVSNLAFYMLPGLVLGPASVGALRAAGVLENVPYVFRQALQNVIPQQAARHFADEGAKRLVPYLVQMGFVVTTLTGIYCIALAAAPELWLHLLYGSKYEGYGYVLVWGALWAYVASFEFPLGIGLLTTARTRPSFVSYVIGFTLTIVSIYPLATMFGLVGLLIGSTVITVVQQFVMLSGLRKALREARAAPTA